MEKKKIIMIAISAILCLSVGIGIFQAVNGNNAAKETERVSSVSDSTASNAESPSFQTEPESTLPEENSNITEKNHSDEKNNNSQSGKASSSSDEITSRQESARQPQQETPADQPKEPESFDVSISITCHNAVRYNEMHDDAEPDIPQSGYILSNTSHTAAKGDTVFDVLSSVCAENDITIVHQRKTYIQSIGGLSEKDCGGASGWMFRVNGVAPNKSVGKYVLSEGDVIEFYYVTSPSDK